MQTDMRTERVAIRLTPALKERAAAAAAAESRSLSNWLEKMIREATERAERGKPD